MMKLSDSRAKAARSGGAGATHRSLPSASPTATSSGLVLSGAVVVVVDLITTAGVRE